jgi:hypothetical protein
VVKRKISATAENRTLIFQLSACNLVNVLTTSQAWEDFNKQISPFGKAMGHSDLTEY